MQSNPIENKDINSCLPQHTQTNVNEVGPRTRPSVNSLLVRDKADDLHLNNGASAVRAGSPTASHHPTLGLSWVMEEAGPLSVFEVVGLGGVLPPVWLLGYIKGEAVVPPSGDIPFHIRQHSAILS